MRWMIGGLLAAIVAGCGTQQAPVPVVGRDVALLVGEWTGFYESGETGRSGSILFNLAADADTAHGDVVMIPAGSGTPFRAVPRLGGDRRGPGGNVLTIRFVRVVDDRVQGTLAPYRDPACGCVVDTMFEGRLEGDRIAGSFQSRRAGSDRVVTGTWTVTRR